MLVVTGTMRVPDGAIDEMKTACATMARKTRQEAGCLDYAFWQNVEDPCEFRVYEEWRDLDCLKAHGKADHMEVYRDKLKQISVTGRDINLYDPGPATKL